jgi:hypothetical protein
MKYKPDSVFRYDPNERLPTENESEVIVFLEHALAYSIEQLEYSKKTNHLCSAGELQIQAMTLRNVIDSILSGAHDKNHPIRVIKPKARAREIFAMIPMP